MTTTHTVMSQSHFGETVWQEVISDTVLRNTIDYSTKKLGISYRTVFDMRHKILLALQELPETEHILLDGVSELDETFVLECYKGNPFRRLPDAKPTNMEPKRKSTVFPMNTSVFELVLSAKEMLTLPRPTGQSRMPKSCQTFCRPYRQGCSGTVRRA